MASKPTKKQLAVRAQIAVLSDPKVNADIPMFGYRAQTHSQAEEDYRRLQYMASQWAGNHAFTDALTANLPQNLKGPEEFSRALSSWMDYAPTASPGVITAFAQQNLAKGTPGLSEALSYDAELQHKADSAAQNPGGSAGTALATSSWLDDHTAWLRGITRTALDAAIAPLQAVEGAISGASGALGIMGANLNGQEADWGQAAAQLAGILPPIAGVLEAQGVYKTPNPWEQTTAGQTLLDFMGMPSGTTTGTEVTPGAGTVSTGDGWLTADENSGVGLAQRQATYQSARNKYNESWSLGRGLFSMVTDSPDSTLYKVGSGLVDAAASIFLDPTIVGAKAKIARDAVVATRRLAAGMEEANTLKTALADAAKLTEETKKAHAARLAELDTQMALDTKYLDKLPAHVKDEAKALMADEDALKAARPLDQAERDAWVSAQREQATMPTDQRYYDLTGRREELAQALAVEESRVARNAARRSVRGRIKLTEPDARLVDDLHTRYGPDGLENHYADLSTDAGNFVEQFPGGHLTADVLPAAKRGTQPVWEPSYTAGGEGVVAWAGTKAPVVKEAEALIDAPDTVANALRDVLLRSKGVARYGSTKAVRQEILDGYHELLTNPDLGATYGHLFSYAVSTGTTKVLAEALAHGGIDGIGGVRRVLGTGDKGVWWSNAANLETRALPVEVTAAMGREALPTIRPNIDGLRSSIRAIDTELHGIVSDAKERVAAAAARYDAYQAATAATRLDEAANEAKLLREQLLNQAGIQHTPDLQKFVDGGKMYDFLFRGRAGQRAFQALTEMDNPAAIMRVTGWDAATAAAVAKATDRESILLALAPEYGLSIDHSLGRITTGLRYKRGAAVERSKFYAGVERAVGTFVPLAQRVDYGDKDQMVKTLQNYMDYFGMDRKVTDDFLNRIINETDEFNQRNHVTGLFDKLQEHIIDRAATKWGLTKAGRDNLVAAANEGTRVYRRAEEAGHEYWQERISRDAWAGHVMKDGEVIRLPNAHLDSEFAQGGTILPDPRHLIEQLGRVSGLITQYPTAQAGYELVSKIATDWWRTAMLLRGAYIVRNIAEEQIRMFLTGSLSMFSNPLRMAASMLATREHSPATQRMIERFKSFDEGIDGTKFKVPDDYERDLVHHGDEFLAVMMDDHSMLDNRMYRNAVNNGVLMVGPKGESGFSNGWGHQLMLLRSSYEARIVAGDYPHSLAVMLRNAKKRGQGDPRDTVMDWYFGHPEGAERRAVLAKSSKEMRKLVSDEQGFRDYLFGPVGSVQARIDEMTTGQQELRNFIRTGVLKSPAGEKVWETEGRHIGPLLYSSREDSAGSIGRALLDHFKDRIPDGHPIKVPVIMTDAKRFRDDPTIVDKFFSFSARMERTAALGPEWKYAYWQEAAKRAHLLDAESLATMRAHAAEAVPKHGKALGLNAIWRMLDDAKGTGMLKAEDVHAIAGKKAGDHVKALFYDARTRNASWHTMRLAFPFGQAWGNTMRTWGQLAAQHPEQVYKFGKAMTALTQSGSNAVYDAYNAVDPFGDVHYDDSQGFFYHDPNRGDQLSFKYPMFASPLAGVLAGSQDTQLSLQAPVSSLNLAFSGDNPMPGLGPLAVSAVGATGLTDKPGPIGEMIRGLAYPFGEPDPESGLFESSVPAWVKYAVFGSGLAPGGGEAFRRAQQKGALIATASRNDYGDLSDPVNQKRWFADADGVARIASLIRGLGSFILPASPVPVWETKDKAGNWMALGSLAAQYHQQAATYGNDQAIVNLVEQYGEKGLASIISSTSGDKPLSDQAYKFTLANPDEATRIGPDALAIMFPGDPSPITLAWQRANGVRRQLSYAEKQDASLGLLYRLQIAEVNRSAAAGQWTPDQIQEAKDAVLERFGGTVPSRAFDPNYYANLVQGIRNAVDSPVAGQIPSTATAKAALAAYDTALASYREEAKDPRATLTGKKAALWRDALHSSLTDLLAQDPNAAGVIDALMSITKGN